MGANLHQQRPPSVIRVMCRARSRALSWDRACFIQHHQPVCAISAPDGEPLLDRELGGKNRETKRPQYAHCLLEGLI